MKMEFLNRRREALLHQIMPRYEKLSRAAKKHSSLPHDPASTLNASASASPHHHAAAAGPPPLPVKLPQLPLKPASAGNIASESPRATSDVSPTASPRSGRSRRAAPAVGSSSVLLRIPSSIDNSNEPDPVAQYFMTLQQDANGHLSKLAQWTKKEEIIQQRAERVAMQRKLAAEELHSRTEARLERTLSTHEEKIEERRRELESCLTAAAERSDKHVATERQKRAALPKKDHSQEKQLAEQLAEEKRQHIVSKLQRGDQVAQQRKAAALTAQAIKDFEYELHIVAHSEAVARAERSHQYKRSLIQQQVEHRTEEEKRAQEERATRQLEKTLLREAFDLQRQEVLKYVRATTADAAQSVTKNGVPTIVPAPPWLNRRIQREERRVLSSRGSGGSPRSTTTSRMDAAAARKPHPPLTARDALNSRDSARSDASATAVDRAQAAADYVSCKPKFTVAAGDRNPAVSFARWMFV